MHFTLEVVHNLPKSPWINRISAPYAQKDIQDFYLERASGNLGNLVSCLGNKCSILSQDDVGDQLHELKSNAWSNMQIERKWPEGFHNCITPLHRSQI